ncbi:DegT/DnrJ/EryC1/StrS family aminotransferase [Dissulfurimicrobium hydrothermale]|uniref:DegT/DnrJ/EryC1/StrS family aminotransferase n=1 Tax=Dissulfurimicrobium hydrothermale TaxID=1750598 RepID=UPI001EDB18F9|nr:DegT/DnrJ/EryC1/StrS family aminotransferase [Dissulfurimicrobium hydrothermale]UKL13579.1 DegT/DnrJ/EryC1/StrS family aminotransferase [Dissulfurimicrobium hydrothermale]
MKFIDLNRQYEAYKGEIDEAVHSVLESGQFILGEVVERLEAVLAGYVGVRHAIGVSSGTDALVLALMACGVGPGDEVVTTPFSFIATAEAVSLVGARPVFVDIDPITYNMDPQAFKKILDARSRSGSMPRCVIPVSLFGQCPDMDEINDIAKTYGLHVIEDACQSFGARYKGRMSCAVSEIGVTSFFPSKPLGAYGDGGMLFTDDDEIARMCISLRVHGQSRRYIHEKIGLNARLDAIQAAILLVKFSHLEEELKKREEAAGFYTEGLKEIMPYITPPKVAGGRTCVFAQYTVRVKGNLRDEVARFLEVHGVPTAVHYPRPIHLQPAFKYIGLPQGPFPHAEEASREVLSLPMHPFIKREEQETVLAALREALSSLVL